MRTMRLPRRQAHGTTMQALCLASIGLLVAPLSSNTFAQQPPEAPTRGPDAHGSPSPSANAVPDAAAFIDPDGMVTARPEAALRIGPSDRFYPVVILDTPHRLRVVDPLPRKGFLRVALPEGTPALLPAQACEAIDDRSVRTTRPTRLLALHARSGPEASWKSLLDEPLRPGSRLDVVDVVRDRIGGIDAYIVEAPAGATAWLSIDQIVPLPEPQDESPSGPTDAGAGEPHAGDPPTDAALDDDASRRGDQRDSTDRDAESSLMEAMIPPGAEPASSGKASPAGEPRPTNLATNTPAAVIEQGSDTSSPIPGEQEALDPAELEALYQRARQSESFEDELEALLAEHRRTLASLPEDPFNERLRRQLERRIAYLEARIAFRDGPERLAAQRATMPRISEQLRQRLERLRAANEYQIIGRLVISRVYDGKRLPRLYRVRSADALGRTLGYVRPQDGQDLTPYLDRVVGIAGTVEEGPAGSRIVTPERIELLDETP